MDDASTLMFPLEAVQEAQCCVEAVNPVNRSGPFASIRLI
jgi:hypothetical protein